jgi:virulence factor
MRARICIIGNGIFANKFHYPSLHSLENADIVGICAFNEDRLKKTALKYNISDKKIYAAKSGSDYQKMLMELQPHGVYVIGQPGPMLDIWIWCLQNKFILFIEKPMGITLHQARTLAYYAEKNSCITQVSFQRRSAPILNKIREECLKKGAITHAMVEFSKYDINPMFGERDRMLDDYIHAVDTARWICGGEVVEIESRCKRLIVPDINWIAATVYFDNGSSCYVMGSWTSGRRIFRVHMHARGISGEIEIEKEAYLYSGGDYQGVRYDTKEVAGSNELFVYGGFQQKSREFIKSILSGKEETSSSFKDALKTMEVCETILAQALIRKV